MSRLFLSETWACVPSFPGIGTGFITYQSYPYSQRNPVLGKARRLGICTDTYSKTAMTKTLFTSPAADHHHDPDPIPPVNDEDHLMPRHLTNRKRHFCRREENIRMRCRRPLYSVCRPIRRWKQKTYDASYRWGRFPAASGNRHPNALFCTQNGATFVFIDHVIRSNECVNGSFTGTTRRRSGCSRPFRHPPGLRAHSMG